MILEPLLKIECCECTRQYPMEGNLYQPSPTTNRPLLVCPHCGFQHLLSFLPVAQKFTAKAKPKPIRTLKLGGTYYISIHGSRILDSDRVDESGSDDANVDDWDVNDDFILAICCTVDKAIGSRSYKLMWRDVTDDSAFVDVAYASEINYNADTVLVNATVHDITYARCDVPSGYDFWQVQDSEGDNTHVGWFGDDNYAEYHWGLSAYGYSDYGHEYAFQLYDITEGAIIGTCGSTITIQGELLVGAARYASATRVDQSGSDDGDVTGWNQANDFIIGIRLYHETAIALTRSVRLQWRNITDSGSFADVSTTGEIRYTAVTNLVDGNPLLVGEKLCDAEGGYAWLNGLECEGDNTVPGSGEFSYTNAYYTEHQIALDCATAPYSKEYEFRLVDDELLVPLTTCLPTITMMADPAGGCPRQMMHYAQLRRA